MSAVLSTQPSRGLQLARKPCGNAQCPNGAKDLWAKAHLAVMHWDELMQHPTCPELRAKVTEHMNLLRAAAKIAEPMMEVRLDLRRTPGPNPDCT